MRYNSNHTLGRHIMFLYVYFPKEAMSYYNGENYSAITDVRPFDYTVTCLQ